MALSLFHLHGDLKDLRFPRLLAALRDDRFTGVFQVTTHPAEEDGEEITREVHFSGGHIAWAISTERDESLKAYLLRHGNVTEAVWASAEERAREGTLREALIGTGAVNARELTQLERGRAEEIVLALFGEAGGEYRVRERQLSPGTPDLSIDCRQLVLKGILEIGDRALIMDEIGSLDTVFVLKRPVLEEPGLTLPGEFQSVIKHIDGKRSIAQICALISLPDYFACSIFAALSMIGAVRRNYAKSQPRARAEIVKGAEVAARETPPGGEPQETAQAPAALAAAVPAAVPAAEPALPPITTDPFPGEGPVSGLETDEEEEIVEPAVLVAPAAPRPASPPVYRESGPEEGSRPWFLLGGAAAVGFAALFLILMAQNRGDAGETTAPAEAASTLAGPPPSAIQAPDDAESAASPDSADDQESQSAPDPAPPAAAPPVAAPSRENILGTKPALARTGRESLIAGDFRAAARQFGGQVAQSSGAFTIQLLTACQDETVRRAVESAGASPSLFILSATVEGRSCYRVYWGRYPSKRRAQEALHREVPAPFLREHDAPRITRLSGS